MRVALEIIILGKSSKVCVLFCKSNILLSKDGDFTGFLLQNSQEVHTIHSPIP